jgi:hypothetical protein
MEALRVSSGTTDDNVIWVDREPLNGHTLGLYIFDEGYELLCDCGGWSKVYRCDPKRDQKQDHFFMLARSFSAHAAIGSHRFDKSGDCPGE